MATGSISTGLRPRTPVSRSCGGWEVLQVSLPLVVSTISTTVMIFIDRMFLLWYAPKAMWGLGTAVTAIVGQQLGRNRAELAARATWTALAIALAYMGTMALFYVAILPSLTAMILDQSSPPAIQSWVLRLAFGLLFSFVGSP